MKTVTLRTSISSQVLALMCTAEFCPFTMDAFECPFWGGAWTAVKWSLDTGKRL